MSTIEHYYIHWPFCKNKCHYCDFVAIEQHETFFKQYHDALMHEIDAFFDKHPAHNIKTIFFGGGTPSLYPLDLLQEVVERFKKESNNKSITEMTLEVNPSGVTHQMLTTWKNLGFNRLSVGVQVLNDAALHTLNRKQTTQDVLQLFEKVFDYSFDVSADLIIGLPTVTEQQWWHTVHTILQWPIQHISIYFLTIHENTPLAHRLSSKELSLIDDGTMVQLYQETIALLARHGLKQYEISNFARTNKESIHNQAYWQRKTYKGFGLGAASLYGGQRFVNQKNLGAYIRQWSEGVIENTGRAAPFSETLTEDQQRLEHCMLSLRQTKGLALDDLFYSSKTIEQKKQIHQNLTWLAQEGFITINHDIVQLTPRGMVYENEIVTKLH